MAQTSLLISLPQLVDMALGSPEIGAVNFTVLNAVLHVIIQQMHLQDCSVEYRGPDRDRINSLLSTTKPISLKITEYYVPTKETTKAAPYPQNHNTSSFIETEVNTIDPRRDSKDEPKVGTSKDGGKVVVVERTEGNVETMPLILANISQARYQELESDIYDLKNKMNEILELPSNATLMEAIRNASSEKITPVNDLWHALALAKRVDAAETGLNKVSSMLEDLVKEMAVAGGQVYTQAIQIQDDKRGSKSSFFADIAKRLESIEQKIGELENKRGSGDDDANAGDNQTLEADVENLKNIVKSLEQDITNINKSLKGKNIAELIKDVEELKIKITGSQEQETATTVDETQITEINNKLNELVTNLNNMDETYNHQMKALENQLVGLEKELGALLERVNTSLSTQDNTDGSSLSDLYNKLNKLQEDLEGMSKVVDKLTEDQDEKQMSMDALIEQIELLKTAKADREDLEDALADKADTQHMNRKVSHDQFDAACGDLTRSLEETMNKLMQQESIWHSTLEEIQITIGSKIDKQEFDPLREFVNRKIKALQLRLKALLAMKQDQEAAGTKSKILKDVNCISCDKDVIMYKENKFATLPSPPVMPGTRSMRPYITYELDAVRKQQKSLPQGRNMNHLETALHEVKAGSAPAPALDKIDKNAHAAHLCNRYCGGSHTMTTPQQRVAHIGHFLTQWGPQAVSLEEGHVMGKDGQMYKAREGGDASPRKDQSPQKDPRKASMSIQTEESREQIKRMSSKILPSGKSRLSITFHDQKVIKLKVPSINVIAPEPEPAQEPIREAVKEPAPKPETEPAPAKEPGSKSQMDTLKPTDVPGEKQERRRSSRKSTGSIRRKSSKIPSTASRSSQKLLVPRSPRGSSSKRGSVSKTKSLTKQGSKRDVSRSSVRKLAQTTLKRVSGVEKLKSSQKVDDGEGAPAAEKNEPESAPAAEETPAAAPAE